MHETYWLCYGMSWSVGEFMLESQTYPLFSIWWKNIGGYIKFARLHVSFWNVFLSNLNKNHAAIINVPSIVLNNLSLSAFYGYYVVQAHIRSDCILIHICEVFMYLYTHVILRNKMKKNWSSKWKQCKQNKTKQKTLAQTHLSSSSPPPPHYAVDFIK